LTLVNPISIETLPAAGFTKVKEVQAAGSGEKPAYRYRCPTSVNMDY
jgi:hypothetical protein